MAKTSRKLLFSAAAGLITGFCYAAGRPLELDGSIDLLSPSFYLRWLGCVLLAAFLTFLSWEAAAWFERQYGKREAADNVTGLRLGKWNMVLSHRFCVILLLVCWLPALLSIFPGAFSYDALSEWQQVRDGALTSHHPVLHVLLLGGLVEGVHTLTGSYNAGIAIYTVIQMLLLANVFAWTIRFLQDFKIPVPFQAATLLFYGLSPVVQLFAVCATKDVLFTAAELLFFLYTIRLLADKERFFRSRRQQAGFAASALFTMILRNNGLYIVLFMLPVLLLCTWAYWKKYMVLLVFILLPYWCYTGPLYHMLDITPGGVEEMLSVPIQQMARVHKYDYASLEPQDLELLYQILPKENLDSYRASVSDFVKKGFQREAFDEHKKEFIHLWIKWGLEHPLTYINSFLLNTVDFWYPHAVVDGYQDAYGKSSYFDYQVDVPGNEIILLPGLHTFYETISHDREAQRFPLAFLVLSPGWYFILALNVFFYLWCHRRYTLWIPQLILLLSMLTVLLGPMALVRYVLIFFFAFPVLAALPLFGRRIRAEALNCGLRKER